MRRGVSPLTEWQSMKQVIRRAKESFLTVLSYIWHQTRHLAAVGYSHYISQNYPSLVTKCFFFCKNKFNKTLFLMPGCQCFFFFVWFVFCLQVIFDMLCQAKQELNKVSKCFKICIFHSCCYTIPWRKRLWISLWGIRRLTLFSTNANLYNMTV